MAKIKSFPTSFQEAQKDHLSSLGVWRIPMLRAMQELVWAAEEVAVHSQGLHVHCNPHQPEGPVRVQKEESFSATAGAQGSLPANTANCYWCCSNSMSKATARHVRSKTHQVDASNNSSKKGRGRKKELLGLFSL